jgi:transposase, IS30 family
MRHLNLEQRYIISEMYSEGKSLGSIGLVLNKCKLVISREICRNCDKRSGRYLADQVQRKTDARKRVKNTRSDFNREVQEYVDSQLLRKHSPEQIVGLAKRDGVACVSHERIYQHVWKDKRTGGTLHKQLRNKGKKYRKRGSNRDNRGLLPNRVNISERPIEVERRERVGDWEIDTIIGKDKRGAIVTINDRATGLLRMKKLKGKDATELANEVIVLMMDLRTYNKTMTSDNGKEFARFDLIAKELNLDYYFANPYSSWERGSNENLNGLIRQYIPKGTDLNTVTDDYVQWVEDELNDRPRKRHNFDTPNNVFQATVALAC